MRRLTAAVLATAAVGTTVVGIGSPPLSTRRCGPRSPLQGRDIRSTSDGYGSSTAYSRRELPPAGVRRSESPRSPHRLPSRRLRRRGARRTAPPRRWLRFVPAAAVIDAGQSRAVAVQLQLPADAEPGVYGVVLGVRPGDSEGARLTFRIEPAESTRAWLRQAANLAIVGDPRVDGSGSLVVLLVRGQQAGSKRLTSLRSTMRVRRDH